MRSLGPLLLTFERSYASKRVVHRQRALHPPLSTASPPSTQRACCSHALQVGPDLYTLRSPFFITQADSHSQQLAQQQQQQAGAWANRTEEQTSPAHFELVFERSRAGSGRASTGLNRAHNRGLKPWIKTVGLWIKACHETTGFVAPKGSALPDLGLWAAAVVRHSSGGAPRVERLLVDGASATIVQV